MRFLVTTSVDLSHFPQSRLIRVLKRKLAVTGVGSSSGSTGGEDCCFS